MKRLTIRNSDGRARLELHRDKGRWSVSVSGNPITLTGDAVDRLAAYEDTGMEPEEVERCKLALMGKSVAEITEFEGVPIERLKQLAEAVKAGRVIAPPCQAGDVLWTYHNWPIERVYSFCVTSVSCLDGVVMIHTDRMGVIPADNVGKTVFLTHEEAEGALAGGVDHA